MAANFGFRIYFAADIFLVFPAFRVLHVVLYVGRHGYRGNKRPLLVRLVMSKRRFFYDIILSKLSLQKPVPKFFRSVYLRIFMMMVLMTVLTVKLIPVWGDYYAMGKPFVLVLTVTTIVGIILGVIFNERIWCMFCPMGTMANWLGRGKQLLQISSGCKECGACAKVCRMQIIPQNYKTSGEVTHGDCLKCSYCVKVCPVNALSFDSNNVSDRMSQKRGLES